MSENQEIGRRDFIKVSLSAAGGLVISFNLPEISVAAENVTDHRLNVFVEVATDNSVTITAPLPEIGQGVRTALPMIVADELECEWDSVKVVQATADEKYGGMTVGGSDSVASYWLPLRRAGALARELLISAAANRWKVARDECRAKRGQIIHLPSKRSLSYGVLAKEAAQVPRPTEIPLKDARDFQLVGTPVKRVDLQDIVTGNAQYGYDVEVPGMLYAMIERCPVEGGRVRSFDSKDALKIEGVKQVFELKPAVVDNQKYGAVRGGVVVVADGFWSAQKGREALKIIWDEGANAKIGSEQLQNEFRLLKDKAGQKILRNEGNTRKVLADAAKRIEAEYELPILAHGCLEPMNFTADVKEDGCRMWGPTQNPRLVQTLAAKMLGLPPDKVEVNITLAGGGFGRRLAYDYAMESAAVSKQARAPIKLVWTRPDDVRHDYFRTPSYHRMVAALDEKNTLAAWYHHIVTSPLLTHILGPDVEYPELYDVSGAADFPYDVPNLLVEYTPVNIGLQLGSWRSVAHSFNVFVLNSFLDEIAAAIGMDPLAFHLKLLGEARAREIKLPLPGRRGTVRWHTGKIANVLKLAAEKSDWSKPLPKGKGRGIACCYFKNTFVAHVAEVSVSPDRKLSIHRIVAAVDCGRVVNPEAALAQVEGAAMDGVASVIKWEITYKNGRVEQSTFRDYPLLTITEAPPVEVYFIPSEEPPQGLGEPPYPSVAPAITNAIFSVTGKRIRRLPIKGQDLNP